MKTTIAILMVASSAALLAETPRDLVFRGSKIEFGAHALAAPTIQPQLKLQGGELSLGPASRVVAPAGAYDLIAPARTRQEIIRLMQAAATAKPPASTTHAVRRTTPVPTAGTDLIGTQADRDRILRDVKISDTEPAQPGR